MRARGSRTTGEISRRPNVRTRSHATLDGLIGAYYAAKYDNSWDNKGPFASLCQKTLSVIEPLAEALRNPLSPKAAKAIETGITKMDRLDFVDWTGNLLSGAEALRWVLAGANPAKLARLRRFLEQCKARDREQFARSETPEALDRNAVDDSENTFGRVIEMVKRAFEADYHRRELTLDERALFVQRMAAELGNLFLADVGMDAKVALVERLAEALGVAMPARE